MLDGYYTAVVDEDSFESDYIRLDGLRDGHLEVTLKKDQPIWPERTGEGTAEDLNGTDYVLVDEVWYIESEAPRKSQAELADAS